MIGKLARVVALFFVARRVFRLASQRPPTLASSVGGYATHPEAALNHAPIGDSR